MKLTLEIFTDNYWQTAGELSLLDEQQKALGYRSKSFFTYDEEYVVKYFGCKDNKAVSVNLPIGFGAAYYESWPPFILDILPSGYARRYWLGRLELKNQPSSDWELLQSGACNPVGNLRVKEAVLFAESEVKNREEDKAGKRPNKTTFELAEILEKRSEFLNYAYEQGASVAGSSGAQGDAPKLLLSQNKQGEWLIDGTLADDGLQKSWLIKMPRGRQEIDTQILKSEAIFIKAAQKLGLYVIEPPEFKSGMLFVPRFDREIYNGRLYRHGLESLCSVAKVAEFGVFMALEEACELILKFSSRPKEDLLEFILRDLLNQILLNTDNHGRNTAFLKNSITNQTYLSPIYDLAPMALDPEGIVQLMRWKSFKGEKKVWLAVCRHYDQLLKLDFFAKQLAIFLNKLKQLPQLLLAADIDKEIYNQVMKRLEEIMEV